MIMLYRGLVGSVLEYGTVCYAEMARTHMLRMERVQYRGIRIALGHMCSTLNNSLGVLSSMAPLAERFVYLNFRYLVVVFYHFDQPLKRRLETLMELILGRCIAGYSEVMPEFLATHFVSYHMEGHFPGFRHLCIWWWLLESC
jgi:hypothetical protein